MQNIFFILGYGIPKDIIKDENYKYYLSMAFNKIYDYVGKNNIKSPIIIFSGGKTDCYKPFKRTEAGEMIRWFKNFIKEKNLKKETKHWSFLAEKKALSTLENFLGSNDILKKKKIQKANITIFCEKTRENRIKKLAKKTLNGNFKIKVDPIDFDTSSNRYLAPEFIKKKETAVLKYDLWALKTPENFKKYHKLFEEKFEFLRKAGPRKHEDALKAWWEKKWKDIQNNNLI